MDWPFKLPGPNNLQTRNMPLDIIGLFFSFFFFFKIIKKKKKTKIIYIFFVAYMVPITS
jgi:hypothetical protein